MQKRQNRKFNLVNLKFGRLLVLKQAKLKNKINSEEIAEVKKEKIVTT